VGLLVAVVVVSAVLVEVVAVEVVVVVYFTTSFISHSSSLLIAILANRLRAAIRNFHLGPCKIEKSKIAKLCHNKGLPKPFIKI